MTTAVRPDHELTLLDMLAAAGGEESAPSDINPLEAQALFERRQERQANALARYRRVFRYRPWDGAVAFHNVLMRLFGTAGVPTNTETMFGPEPPEQREVPTGLDTSVLVPWGRIDFPIFGEGAFFTNGGQIDNELGLLYELHFLAPNKFGPHIRGLFKEIEQELEVNSIYRGKAFDGQEMPRFLDLSQVDPDRVVYSDEVTEALEADVWSLIEHTELMRSLDVPLKHAVLLEGEYGTGKTLAGLLTAQKAMNAKQEWTFIQCRPGRDEYEEVMATARLYQPCVAFFEDIDTIASTGEDDALARLLDIYDGATSKGAELLVIVTTNHPDRIHKAMIRPGRIDRVISVGKQDATSIRKMIQTSVEPQLLGNLDFDVIAEAMADFSPAFIKEAIHRTMRHAIVRCRDRPDRFATLDFIRAAESLYPHLKLMNDAGEGKKNEGLEKGVERIVADVLGRTLGMNEYNEPELTLKVQQP